LEYISEHSEVRFYVISDGDSLTVPRTKAVAKPPKCPFFMILKKSEIPLFLLEEKLDLV
jgi:hypothetical protein